MKRKMKKLMAFALAAVMCVSVCMLSGCGESDESVELTYYVIGTNGNDTETIITQLEEKLLDATGIKVNFEFLSQDAYDLVINSGEDFDIAYAPDWMGYWKNAQAGAFAELTDEQIKKNAPYVWENMQESIEAAKSDGMCFGIASNYHYAPDRCFVARGDLMDKYGIKDLNSLEDIEAYLTAVAENEKDIIPFNVEGSLPYSMFMLAAGDWGWVSPTGGGFGDSIYFNINDPECKVFIADEQPEMVEFTKMMKRWNEKGFFSKSVLSNKTSSLSAFKSGQSALAMTASPSENQSIYDELNSDDRAAWDVRFFPRIFGHQQMYALTNSIVAISHANKHVDECLKVINELYSNEEIYKLMLYGIEGKHYTVNEDGYMVVPAGADEAKGWFNTGVVNDEWNLEKELTYPGHEVIEEKLAATRDVNPLASMSISDEEYKGNKAAISEVYNSMTTPRCYGIFEGTAEEAVAKELAALKTAGVDNYRDSVQRQIDEYLASKK